MPDTDDTFRELVARNAGALARVARHYEALPDARRDLEQEILVALWRALPSFRGEATERTWVYRIAHNVAATHVAKALRTKRADAAAETLPAPNPLDVVEKRAEVRSLDERVRKLDLASRQLVLLALEGCTMAEIADVTGLSVTNVTTRLSRLRRELEPRS